MSDKNDTSGQETTVGEQKDDKVPATSPGVAEVSDLAADAELAEGMKDLDFILDIPLQITVELGRTRMLINDLLQLGQGSVVELTKLAQEPMDIHVNGKLFARGEVVVVNEKFGVRLTDIISPIERVKTLG
jgi:flagellar motor switch protein FliN/FliY